MKRINLVALVIGLACSACKEDRATSNSFFMQGELSADSHSDSIIAKNFSERIRLFGDSSIRHQSDTVRRLTISSPVIGGTCMISVGKRAGVGQVSFRRRGDGDGTDKMGLGALSFSYSSKSSRFDSMFSRLDSILIKVKDDLVNNPEIPEQVGDGDLYLFEHVQDGKYQLWLRLYPGYEGLYPDVESFTELCESMKAFIPDCILPPSEDILAKKGVLFPVFEIDSAVALTKH